MVIEEGKHVCLPVCRQLVRRSVLLNVRSIIYSVYNVAEAQQVNSARLLPGGGGDPKQQETAVCSVVVHTGSPYSCGENIRAGFSAVSYKYTWYLVQQQYV